VDEGEDLEDKDLEDEDKAADDESERGNAGPVGRVNALGGKLAPKKALSRRCASARCTALVAPSYSCAQHSSSACSHSSSPPLAPEGPFPAALDISPSTLSRGGSVWCCCCGGCCVCARLLSLWVPSRRRSVPRSPLTLASHSTAQAPSTASTPHSWFSLTTPTSVLRTSDEFSIVVSFGKNRRRLFPHRWRPRVLGSQIWLLCVLFLSLLTLSVS
jgi:hypothetical protein